MSVALPAHRATTAVFWIACVGVLLAQLFVLGHSIFITRLWEDEAFNLTVPLNLTRGLGYTSDGTLSGSVLTPFDPRISTGPAVLLPIAALMLLGIDPVIAGRLIVAASYAALLVGLAIIGKRVGGRWAALAAVAVPLTINTAAGISPIQGPADILGEIPAAALAVWALVVLPRRAWAAGLLVGLAVQAKYISLLFLPAFALALWFRDPGLPWRRRVRAAVLPAAMVAAPTLLVELIAFAVLGPAGFVRHVRDTWSFVRNAGQPGTHTTPWEKLAVLVDRWFLPDLVTIAAAVAAVVVVTAAAIVVRRDRRRLEDLVATVPLAPLRDIRAYAIAAGVGFLTYLLWWVTAAQTPLWLRHPAPGLFAFAPICAAFVVLSLRVLGTRSRAFALVGGATMAAVLSVQVAVNVSGVAERAASPSTESLADQRAVADGVAALGEDRYAAAWGGPVSIAVLSGAHVGLWDAGEWVASWKRLLSSGDPACMPPSVTIGGYAVCDPASLPPWMTPAG